MVWSLAVHECECECVYRRRVDIKYLVNEKKHVKNFDFELDFVLPQQFLDVEKKQAKYS